VAGPARVHRKNTDNCACALIPKVRDAGEILTF
jgi:hypothetical protein